MRLTAGDDLLCRGRRYRTSDFILLPIKDEAGRVLFLFPTGADTTEKRNLATEHDALLSRLQLHIDRMPLAYVLFDADFRVTDWNSTAERIFGYTKEEMLGHGPPFQKFVPPSFWNPTKAILDRVRSGDMDSHSTNENLTKDGRTTHLRVVQHAAPGQRRRLYRNAVPGPRRDRAKVVGSSFSSRRRWKASGIWPAAWQMISTIC